MENSQSMDIYEARLASFSTVQPTTKRGNTKNAKALKWPHATPFPSDLAKAGFYYKPTSSNPDNVQCFICDNGLDGWEEDDSPIMEHVVFAPDCGWAINLSIEQDLERGELKIEDPMAEKFLNARKATFGNRWPHEGKRGWTCKTQKMAEAGWYYCPTDESDDYAKCPYCNLSLDGWEPKDKPYNEHERRSPDCAFFTLSKAFKSKPARGKVGRPSKAFRASTHSVNTIRSEDPSFIEIRVEEGDSALTTATDMTTTSTIIRPGRKGAKSKKNKSKWPSKAAAMKANEVLQGSSFLEPEDDDFEVKDAQALTKAKRGMKRTSDEMELDHESHNTDDPPSKRRITRSRASTAKLQPMIDITSLHQRYEDTHMADVETMSRTDVPKSKRGGERGKKRGSSAVRKVSTVSTASTASLRAAVPVDDDIEAALEADLDRLLTNDEVESNIAEEERPKTRRLTRTRPASRNPMASQALVRRPTRASTMFVSEPERMDTAEDSQTDLVDTPAGGHHTSDTERVSRSKPPAAAKKGRRKDRPNSKIRTAPESGEAQKISEDRRNHQLIHPSAVETEDTPAHESAEAGRNDASHLVARMSLTAPTKLRQPMSRQASRQLTGRHTRSSANPNPRPIEKFIGDDEGIEPNWQTLGDDSGLASSASFVRESKGKNISEKGAVPPNKGSKTKKDLMVKQDTEDNDQAPSLETVRNEEDARDDLVRTSDEAQDPSLAIGVAVEEAPVLTEDTCSLRAEVYAEPMPVLKEKIVETSDYRQAAPKVAKLNKSKRKAKQTVAPAVPESKGVPKLESMVDMSMADAQSCNASVSSQIPASPGPIAASMPSMPERPTSKEGILSPMASPQSSDAENHPPSSRPSQHRPPLIQLTPSRSQTVLIPLAVSTPGISPSKYNNAACLQSTFPWTQLDLERILLSSPVTEREKEEGLFSTEACLTSPEKKMTVEEWIHYNAMKGEEKLRNKCERLVGRFESEGVKALKALEGIVSSG